MKNLYNEYDSDRTILRELAKKLLELSGRPEEAQKRELWYRHNALEETRPLIICNPENGWNEIVKKEQLKCKDETARSWEFILKIRIFWAESMGDDQVTEPWFQLGYVYSSTGWGMSETKIGGEHGGAYKWEAPLKDYRDIEKLTFPEIIIDRSKTKEQYDLANDIFGDLLDVRITGRWWWTLGLTMTLVYLRGLEQMMLDMYDDPEGLHNLMSLLCDGHMYMLDDLQKRRLLYLNNDGHVGSGGLGYTNELPAADYDGKNVRTVDMWGFAESQETTAISAEMFEEFVFRYQLPLLSRFGLNCYGCCEPLEKRWHIIKKIPRLRRISVSPWADTADMAQKLGDSYIFSYKPIPTDLAVGNIDREYIRKNLRKTLNTTKNCRVEIIMKDNHTIGRNPQNVIDWCKIAREEAERI